jgi:hypothetical protein
MAATPVVVSINPPLGGAALRVAANTEVDTEGGAAVPVYIITDADVASGRWSVQGNINPIAMTVVADGRAVVGQPPIPVYVVAGSFGTGPDPPTPDTSYLLTENNTILTAENGNRITWS